MPRERLEPLSVSRLVEAVGGFAFGEQYDAAEFLEELPESSALAPFSRSIALWRLLRVG